MNVKEIKKLYNFIFIKKYLNDENNILDKYTLIRIQIVSLTEDEDFFKDFNLTKEQEKVIINSYLKLEKKEFDDNTPKIILNNLDCVKETISDPNKTYPSCKHLIDVNKEIEEYIIEYFKNNCCRIYSEYPNYLKENFEVVKSVLQEDEYSANEINWEVFSDEEKNVLVDILVEKNYLIKFNTPEYLKNNDKLKKVYRDWYYAVSYGLEVETVDKAIEDPICFKQLIDKKYFANKNQDFLKNVHLNCFYNDNVLSYSIFQLININEYFDRYIIIGLSPLINAALTKIPNICNLNSIFSSFSEFLWKNYKKNNYYNLGNIFRKVCSGLSANDNFNNALKEMNFLILMESVLKDKYDELYNAMKKYHCICHQDNYNLQELESYKNTISNLASLYIAKSKEEFKKAFYFDIYNEIKPYFKLNINNSLVYEKVKYYEQKKYFKKLFENNDVEILNFLNGTIQKFEQSLDKNTINQMIKEFVLNEKTKLNQIIETPKSFKEYKRMQNANQLIKRLNLGNIFYDDLEVSNYQDIIKFKDNKYFYDGPILSYKEINECENFEKLEKIFNKIKKEIILKIKSLSIDINDNNIALYNLEKFFPFTDEYFIFDKDMALKKFCLNDLIIAFINPAKYLKRWTNFIKEDINEAINDYLVNKNVIWFLLLTQKYQKELNKGFRRNIMGIIENMPNILSIAHDDLKTFKDYLYLNNLIRDKLNILGISITNDLCNFNNTTISSEKIIERAYELVSQMAKRTKSTVPYINGECLGYSYSMYDTLDETLVVSGIKTNSCFRIGGVDNDFLHYCALDKNGFVIKIFDVNGEFFARASGFRNGNCIFINQLRTVLDSEKNSLSSREKEELITVFKKACEDIIETSCNNAEEKRKIDHIFITKSYALGDYEGNVSSKVTNLIGKYPMETNSKNWYDFCNNTKGIRKNKGFTTDYGQYPLICIASVKQGELTPEDIRFGDVEALYERKRNKIIVSKATEEVIRKINKIKGINCYLNNISFTPIKITNNSSIVIGDNWYIIYDNNVIVEKLCLDFDKKAVDEFNITKEVINNHLDINKINEEVKARLLSKNINGV